VDVLNVVLKVIILLVDAGSFHLLGQKVGVAAGGLIFKPRNQEVFVVGVELLGNFLNQGHGLRVHVELLDCGLYFCALSSLVADQLL
jgi:hypothetical protein